MSDYVMATATRSESGWWAVEVPSIPGLFTQARTMPSVPAMVADAAQTLGVDVSAQDVRVKVILPEAIQARLDKAKADAAAAEAAQRVAAEEAREVVSLLRRDGYTVREVGAVLGVSPQRVSQLCSA